MQSALRIIYPARCMTCGDLVETDFALCGPCWRDTPFIAGLVCNACGAPLMGHDDDPNVLCDDCMAVERPWSRGRAAMRYADNGRKMVLGLKHGDRTDIASSGSLWMSVAAQPMLQDDTVLVPIPLHWTRLLQRKYNQSALLAKNVARHLDRPFLADSLVRTKRTASLGGKTQDQRFDTLADAIHPHPRRGRKLQGKSVMLVDDVMTSGATLSAATEAAMQAGAKDVCVLLLARAAKEA
ncbi:ComF family protein [Flavimaricola marinus]|uniref:DNA utilization protein GntX n=1 Tax=Flavimaricola marinus TaxID=1819565 RepID=A0A238LCL4_9RHOB|nr:ComF family protein [Flavimaricola marinus]SMY07155.1 DNA utilization protein GntX [Flavimaricola marinus]